MNLEVLMSCMNQCDYSIIHRSGIIGDAVVVNQCDENRIDQISTQCGRALIYSTTERGLTKSRNMAIESARADICLLCDDDELFVAGYQDIILGAYEKIPQADVIIFKMVNRPSSFQDKTMRLRFPKTMKVSSWQISFRRNSLLKSGVRFDEMLGAGTGNGAEEELKFLLDCQKAGLQIWYVPNEIASVEQMQSTWFEGYTEKFFENRGATTRYILGLPVAVMYAVYYTIRKHSMYKKDLSAWKAFCATMKGIMENKIQKQIVRMRK